MSQLSEIANQVLGECESTNDLARALAESGYPHGTWVSAKRQKSGRGRLGRHWISQEGNLFLSMVVRLKPQTLWSWIPLATAVATVTELLKIIPNLSLQIKWPNDVLLNRAKLGGILCEASSEKTNPYVIVGMGLNCLAAPEKTLMPLELTVAELPATELSATSLSQVTGKEVTPEFFRLAFVQAWKMIYHKLEIYGSSAIHLEYQRWALFQPGMKVEWHVRFSNQRSKYKGRVMGLGNSGELIVQTLQEKTLSLFSEEVSVSPAE